MFEEIQKTYRKTFEEAPTIAAVIDGKAVKKSYERDGVESMKKNVKRCCKRD